MSCEWKEIGNPLDTLIRLRDEAAAKCIEEYDLFRARQEGYQKAMQDVIDRFVKLRKEEPEKVPDAEPAGLHGKYIVRRSDTGEEVDGCFVLRPEKDRAAVCALRTYAAETENEELADQLVNWVGQPVQRPIDLKECGMFIIPCWIEEKGFKPCADILDKDSAGYFPRHSHIALDTYGGNRLYKNNYGKTWRCWRDYPTKEDIEATPWEESGR